MVRDDGKKPFRNSGKVLRFPLSTVRCFDALMQAISKRFSALSIGIVAPLGRMERGASRFLPFLSLSPDKQPSYTSWFDADSGRSISLLRIFSSLLLAYPEMQESTGPPWCRPPWGWQERDAVSTPRSLLSDEGFLDFVRSRLPFILLWRMVFII